jgi:hypothetical protein
VTST